ncbi:MAG TPA: hypothetical protein VIM67_11540, partial [Terriglobus sp.]
VHPSSSNQGRDYKEDWLAHLQAFISDEPALVGVDVKVAQELLRHANSRTTLDLYSRAVSVDKRAANSKTMDLLMGQNALHCSAPSTLEAVAK